MSETVSYQSVETDYSTDSHDESKAETLNNWDYELTSLVSASADVIAPCQWMGGVEVSLSTAINSYPVQITEENVAQVVADVYLHLANRVEEKKELEEEEEKEVETEEGEPVKAGRDKTKEKDEPKPEEVEKKDIPKSLPEKAPADSSDLKPEPAPKKEAPAAKLAEQPVSISEKIAAPPRPVAEPAKPSAAVNSSIESKTEIPAQSPTKEALAIITAETVSADHEPAVGSAAKPAASDNESHITTPEPLSAPASIVPEIPQPAIEQVTIRSDAPAAEVSIKAEAIETVISDIESLAQEADLEIVNGAAGLIELAEDEEVLLPINTQIDSWDPNYGFEEEAFPDDPQAPLLLDQPETFYQASEDTIDPLDISNPEAADASLAAEDEFIIRPETEVHPHDELEIYEQPAAIETGPVAEDVEKTLVALVETIQASPPQATEDINEILDKIIEAPAKLEADGLENEASEAEAEEELEELFTELFNEAGIEHTPELIETLARLTLERRRPDKTENTNGEEIDELPQDIGTHEAISKLLTGLSAADNAMTNVCVIGKSAIHLCFSAAA